MQRYLDQIENVLKKFPEEKSQNLPHNSISVVKQIINMSESDRISILEEISLINKNLPFDILNLFVEIQRSSLNMANCYPFIIGPEYMRVKSLVRKRLDSSSTDDVYASVSDISKLSLKERDKYREHQMESNIKYDIYSDIVRYIDKEIKTELEIQKIKNKDGVINYKFEAGVEKIYQKVSNDINDIILNNILDTKQIYVGLAVIRQERLNELYQNMKDFYNSNI